MFKTLVLFSALYHSTTAALTTGKEYDLPPQSSEVSKIGNQLKVSELYWKNYTSYAVPEDAILAGIRYKYGRKVKVYIGQVDVNDIRGAQVQSVAIYGDSQYVTNTYSQTKFLKDNIRILCSNATNIDNIISWISSEKAAKLNPDEDFVITGHESNMALMTDTNLYTGRGTYDDFVVGKVVMGIQSLRFYFADEYIERLKKENFEILAYTKALTKLKG